MRLAVKKLHVEDAAKLQALVVENLDGIEPGLAVLDARLLLGHSTIDVVAMDAAGALVLVAVGLTANEEMILKAVEAYSWCLEYPQALQRLYSGCVLSEERPPRLLFVVERMSDAFQRKIKQLGFPEVDCVEVRHLDVDGVATVYFEALSRIRRLAPTAIVERAPQAPVPAPEPTRGPAGENVITMSGNGTTRAAAVAPRLGKPGQPEATLNGTRAGERNGSPRETGAVVSMINRQAAAVAPSADLPRPAVEPVVLRQPEPVVPAPAVSEPKLTEAKLDADEWIDLEAVAATSAVEPSVAEPVVAKLALVEPSASEPVAAKPVVVEVSVPVVPQLPVVELSAAEPVVAKPVVAEVSVPEPVVAKLPAVEPSVVEPVAPKPVVAEVKAIEPVAAKPAVVEPGVAEPVVAKKSEPAESAPVTKPSVAEPVAAKPIVSEDKPAVPSVAPRPTTTMRTIAPAAPAAAPSPLPPLAKPVATSVPSMAVRPVTPKSFSDTSRPSAEPVAKSAAEPTGERVSFKDLAQALLGGKNAEPRTETPAETAAAPSLTVVTPEAAPVPKPVVAEAKAEPLAAAPAAPALTVESLAAMAVPASPAEQAMVADTAKQIMSALPQEFEGLTFPNDGVLTRQWMDFLNQMSTTK
jgi:hypothetical protein